MFPRTCFSAFVLGCILKAFQNVQYQFVTFDAESFTDWISISHDKLHHTPSLQSIPASSSKYLDQNGTDVNREWRGGGEFSIYPLFRCPSFLLVPSLEKLQILALIFSHQPVPNQYSKSQAGRDT